MIEKVYDYSGRTAYSVFALAHWLHFVAICSKYRRAAVCLCLSIYCCAISSRPLIAIDQTRERSSRLIMMSCLRI